MPFSVNIISNCCILLCNGKMLDTYLLIYYSAKMSNVFPKIQRILVRKISVTCKSCFIIKLDV